VTDEPTPTAPEAPAALEHPKRPSLFIATPAYGSMVSTHYMASVLQLVVQSAREGVELHIQALGKESLITRARNLMVHDFLKSGMDRLMFIDADIEFDPRVVFQMLRLPHDIVGGAYPKKSIRWDAVEAAVQKGVPANELALWASPLAINLGGGATVRVEQGCIETKDVPTGFMMIKREALLRMIEAYPETQYVADHEDMQESLHALFDCIIDVDPDTGLRRYLSEDYAFCRRWQKIGGKAYLFAPARLCHHGTWSFQGDMGTLFVPMDHPDAVPEAAPEAAQ
jgi:hypothetical protein